MEDEKAQHFRFGVVCGGSSLTAAQPLNNIVRGRDPRPSRRCWAGRSRSSTCAFDEAFQIPTETSAEVALRTQQIVAHEAGVARSVDPLGGSYYTEFLTRPDGGGRFSPSSAASRITAASRRRSRTATSRPASPSAARERKAATDCDARKVVGVNVGRRESREQDRGEVFEINPDTVRQVVEKFERVMDTRDQKQVDRTLERLRAAAATDGENVMPHLVECCHAYATVGEMVRTLKGEWGEFREPAGFLSHVTAQETHPESPSPASTDTTSAPRSSPSPCAMPAPTSSTPVCAGVRVHRQGGARRGRSTCWGCRSSRQPQGTRGGRDGAARQAGAAGIRVFVGGTIPEADHDALRALGHRRRLHQRDEDRRRDRRNRPLPEREGLRMSGPLTGRTIIEVAHMLEGPIAACCWPISGPR